MDYRHELKFLVTYATLELIRAKIQHIVKPDIHQTDPEGYVISSLYFDNAYDTFLRENIDGYDNRHKFRLRIYGHSSDLIKLERKSKVHGMTAKKAVSVTTEECMQMMHGQIPMLGQEDSVSKKKLLCEMKLHGLMPKCIVQYQREAFVYPLGNVRITFDKNISGSRDVEAFLEDRIIMTPLLNKDVHILEVKYDNFLPKYISDALEIDQLLQTSFSKYAYAREKLG